MAFKKPVVKTIDADISKLSIYIRSVKKFGKSSLFKHLILAKYGDPTKGLLVEIGHEFGDTLLDNVNTTHVDTYKDFIELKKWLIEEKGKEHDIKIVGFDVVDELVPAFEAEVVRLHNIESTTKKVKSVKAAFGGYNAGIEMAASMIKEYMTELKKAGFGVIAIAHTKMKPVKEKGSIEEDSYQMLTSNLQNAYESAFGDVSDLVLTGYIDRNLEAVGEGENVKKYATTEIRKLYFRGTSLIDAGSRFAPDAVPEYMVFDKLDMGEEFVRVIEEGIKKSKTLKSAPAPSRKEDIKFEEDIKIKDIETKRTVSKSDVKDELDEDDELPFSEDVIEEEVETGYPEDLVGTIRDMFKQCKNVELKSKVKSIIAEYGKLNEMDRDGLVKIYDILK